MATVAEINELVIGHMNRICRPRWNPETDERAYLEAIQVYCRVLASWSPQILRAGMELWEMDWAKSIWPLPAQLTPYMNQASDSLKPPTAPEIEDHSEEPRDRTPEEVAAYRAETDRIVNNIKQRLAFLEKYPEPGGAFAKPPLPRHKSMPAEHWQKFGVEPPQRKD